MGDKLSSASTAKVSEEAHTSTGKTFKRFCGVISALATNTEYPGETRLYDVQAEANTDNSGAFPSCTSIGWVPSDIGSEELAHCLENVKFTNQPSLTIISVKDGDTLTGDDFEHAGSELHVSIGEEPGKQELKDLEQGLIRPASMTQMTHYYMCEGNDLQPDAPWKATRYTSLDDEHAIVMPQKPTRKEVDADDANVERGCLYPQVIVETEQPEHSKILDNKAWLVFSETQDILSDNPAQLEGLQLRLVRKSNEPSTYHERQMYLANGFVPTDSSSGIDSRV